MIPFGPFKGGGIIGHCPSRMDIVLPHPSPFRPPFCLPLHLPHLPHSSSQKVQPICCASFPVNHISSQMAPSEANRHLRLPCRFTRLLLLLLLIGIAGTNGQESPASVQNQDGSSSPSSSSASFVLADPNSGAPQSAYSPPAQPTPVVPPTVAAPVDAAVQIPSSAQQSAESAPAQQQQNSAVGGGGTGGYGSLMAVGGAPPASAPSDPIEQPMGDSPQPDDSNSATKRHQFSQYAVGGPMPEPALVPGVGLAPGGPVPAAGVCPGGASLPIECDPKRPWPQCPPQSYCYATNTVDIGPYFCCPIWSTYGAAWRPATPFYSYAPPPPPNWPEPMRMAAAPAYGGPMAPIRKGRKEQRFDDDGQPLMTEEEQRKILQVMNDWVERQKSTDGEPIKEGGGGSGGAVAERTPTTAAAALETAPMVAEEGRGAQ